MASLGESSELGSSAELVASNIDLLSELLLCLPIKSLLRFKSVSKQWLSLFSDPHFIRRKSLESNSVAGLFAQSADYPSLRYDIVPLHHPLHRRAPLTSLAFVDPPHSIAIISSCNGLLLCSSSYEWNKSESKCYIYNPTTRQFRTLPLCGHAAGMLVIGFGLAFDPSKSHIYKVVCICRLGPCYDHFQIVVYSSETKRWRVSGAPRYAKFTAPRDAKFDAGVYCNGAIHWVDAFGASLCFDLDQELAGEMPMPPRKPHECGNLISYLGESCGHLHLVELYDPYMIEFPVYEMERDRSAWFVKFRVDLKGVVQSYPHKHCPERYHIFSRVLCVGRGEKEEDSFLVLHVPGKVIWYNFRNKTHQVVYNTDSPSKVIQCNFRRKTHQVICNADSPTIPSGWPFVFQYIPTLSPV